MQKKNVPLADLQLCPQMDANALDMDEKKKLGIHAEDGTFHFHGSALSYSYLGTGDMNDGGASWRSLCPSPAFNTKQSFGFVQFIPLSFIFRIGHFNLQ